MFIVKRIKKNWIERDYKILSILIWNLKKIVKKFFDQKHTKVKIISFSIDSYSKLKTYLEEFHFETNSKRRWRLNYMVDTLKYLILFTFWT